MILQFLLNTYILTRYTLLLPKRNIVESLPAAVNVKVADGGHARGRQGEVVVTPGSMVTLECVFLRQRGEPEWSWDTTGNVADRELVRGWADTDQDWHYSLELSNVTSQVGVGSN